MKDLLLFLWQLPQNLLGILWLLINGMFTSCYLINSFDGVYVFKVGFQVGAVSLGRYIMNTTIARQFLTNTDIVFNLAI